MNGLSSSAAPDDLKVFIKREPLKLSKLEDGRYRLIMVMSLEDQMVDRVLFSGFSDIEKFRCLSIPGKSGWTPLPVGFKAFRAAFPNGTLATDCSAFDWTFPAWVVDMLCDLYMDMYICPSPELVRKVRTRWLQVLSYSTIRLPDGSRYQQIGHGLMKSGWFRTIGVNSAAQVLIHDLAALRSGIDRPLTLWTMGDDVVISWPEDRPEAAFLAALATTGILVKQAERTPDFAGFRITADSVTPLYPRKHLFLLDHVAPDLAKEIANAFQMMYCMAKGDDAVVIRNVISKHATVTSRLALHWAHGVVKM
uniref:RNA-dependent RNA polymerase n=1 Tax=Zootermopsis nevadensis sobeli-like virus 1 TaxID=3133522 RepID=A0AAT9JQ75_9VIRU